MARQGVAFRMTAEISIKLTLAMGQLMTKPHMMSDFFIILFGWYYVSNKNDF